MTTISVVITTYGESGWEDLAWSRAYPSTIEQGADQVIVHHEADLPIGPARNQAAAQATGNWLIFLDADDELAPNYVETMRASCGGRKPLTLFQPSVRYLRKGTHHTPAPVMIPQRDLSKDNFLVVGTMVHRSLFRQVGGFEDFPHGFEDWSLWAKCWKAGAEVMQVPRAVYIAHFNPNSKHRLMWRDRRLQVQTHNRVRAALFPDT